VCLLHCYREFVSKEDMLVEINAGFGMGVWNGKCIAIAEDNFLLPHSAIPILTIIFHNISYIIVINKRYLYQI
jgi:hypothetical protein